MTNFVLSRTPTLTIWWCSDSPITSVASSWLGSQAEHIFLLCVQAFSLQPTSRLSGCSSHSSHFSTFNVFSPNSFQGFALFIWTSDHHEKCYFPTICKHLWPHLAAFQVSILFQPDSTSLCEAIPFLLRIWSWAYRILALWASPTFISCLAVLS